MLVFSYLNYYVANTLARLAIFFISQTSYFFLHEIKLLYSITISAFISLPAGYNPIYIFQFFQEG